MPAEAFSIRGLEGSRWGWRRMRSAMGFECSERGLAFPIAWKALSAFFAQFASAVRVILAIGFSRYRRLWSFPQWDAMPFIWAIVLGE